MTDLKRALLSDDLNLIRQELRDPDRVCADGRRPLSVVVPLGVPDLVDLLLDLGVPIDGRDATDLGYTALCVAVREDATAAVEQLLRRGADVNAGDSIRGTPLHHTAVGGQAELARLLLRAGALVDAQDDAGVTPLIRVAVHADVAPSGPLGMMAQAMAYAQGVIENGPAGLSERVHPLHDKHLATAAVLLEAKADPDHMAGNGYSALHQAAENGAVPLVQVLLAAGATAGLRNGKGYTPMHAACDRSHAEVVRILLEAGADPDAADDYGFVALHGAAVQGSVETARVLLAAGADRSPRTRDGYDKITAGMTPADAATAYGYDELAALLR